MQERSVVSLARVQSMVRTAKRTWEDEMANRFRNYGDGERNYGI